MPVFERFDTAVVPFPFAEIPILKRRPVTVLSAASFNAESGATLVAMITTAKATVWPSDIEISDLQSAGLDTPCILRFRLVTIPNDLFVRPLGRLAALDRLRAEGQLARMLLG
ncbi:type II toxin-antitoxin system PemK/MazF family toxin [Rhodovulum strictum]|uniref:Type II toxin-antitoxin system PemK/MazF family toxin n=1 Tax=Rhodovulum strictum TaxID=58314 RepID=A0A844BB48_9RHOB|nr:type II toxin-antitoxin system PemK/MazF family toxin [Rhodovulum strictum]MRH21664.1 type II toxin-antitoxin system PemK/MazF family toxin [Rhodovulum strictum]